MGTALQVGRVDLSLLYRHEGDVLQPVPPRERGVASVWHAGHLGEIALNLMRGKTYLNSIKDPTLSFRTSYDLCLDEARRLIAEGDESCFSGRDRAEFFQRTRQSKDFVFPRIVFGLDKSQEYRLEPRETDEYDEVRILRGLFDLSMVDPISRRTIAAMFGLMHTGHPYSRTAHD